MESDGTQDGQCSIAVEGSGRLQTSRWPGVSISVGSSPIAAIIKQTNRHFERSITCFAHLKKFPI